MWPATDQATWTSRSRWIILRREIDLEVGRDPRWPLGGDVLMNHPLRRTDCHPMNVRLREPDSKRLLIVEYGLGFITEGVLG
ncbi:hypothetical protein ACIHDR_25485, partial [Nocardia sp. NPDC052278]|uniref:hypothetical protein n=1 Tax=Nocardia sp. NPDC052278 TaxID=3364328 RepID=UPI0037C6F8B0